MKPSRRPGVCAWAEGNGVHGEAHASWFCLMIPLMPSNFTKFSFPGLAHVLFILLFMYLVSETRTGEAFSFPRYSHHRTIAVKSTTISKTEVVAVSSWSYPYILPPSQCISPAAKAGILIENHITCTQVLYLTPFSFSDDDDLQPRHSGINLPPRKQNL